MNPRAFDLVKARWFLRGFAESGERFHGESMSVQNKGARRVILRRFKRLLDEDAGEV
jgi:hypothetical protein